MLSIDRVARQLPQVALRPLPRRSPGRRRTGSSSGRGSTRATSRPSRRAARERSSSAPGRSRACALSTPLLLDWFDRWITGADSRRGRRRALLAARARTSGARRSPGRRRTPRSAGTSAPAACANSRHGDGVLAVGARRAATSRRTRTLYDPLDPVPTVGGKTLMPSIMTAGIEDQAAVEDAQDVLCYTSPVLTAPGRHPRPGARRALGRLVGGRHRLHREARRRAPDGTALNLADGIVRARYRDSTAPPLGRRSSRASRRCSRSTSGISRTRSCPATGSGSRSARATSRASTATPTRAMSSGWTGPTTWSSAAQQVLPRRRARERADPARPRPQRSEG